MSLILYPDTNKEVCLPVFVNGIGIGCTHAETEKSAVNAHRIFVTVGGSGSVMLGNKRLDVPVGCGLYVNKGVDYSCFDMCKDGKKTDGKVWLIDMISFGFESDLFKIQLFTSEKYSFFRFRDPVMVSASIRRVHNLLMSDPKYGAFLASAELYSLLIKLNRETLDIPQLTHKSSPVISSVIEYIDDNYTDEISLGDLCKAAGGISEQYLCRLFKQYTGERPIEFILHKRIGMARSYLEKTDMPISDVAKLTGFNNTSYFYRNFKKFVGISPLTCRQNSLKKSAGSDDL